MAEVLIFRSAGGENLSIHHSRNAQKTKGEREPSRGPGTCSRARATDQIQILEP